ncbi:motility protein A [Candidatus Uabimicrobium amorphum]|uniref:Flagellar motor protein MotP n=1 Tax=Uabimicrobium amorphum TaxID=2596890 RepID=A0A5S9F4D6_UABAM|nr:MotA/TolQ/ExbB proton channel family protein [Candidatus Uabimicrobium amorphum]BBM85023.1 flagellar motor protein MotP [Candidatus Uabimicrobium amorphum]
MDLATLGGIILGLGLIFGSILMGSGASIFLHIPSILITVGGTIASTLINFPLAKVTSTFAIVKNTFQGTSILPHNLIKQLIEYNQIVRKDGIMSLEEKMDEMPSFMKGGMQMVIDNTPPEIIRDILTLEMDAISTRHAMGKKILDSMGAAAPAFGMIGTLIGLVQMLQNLSDPSGIGAGMAVALLTTFYGALMANLVFIPLAGKLESRNYEEQVINEIITEGILAIQSGEHPFVMKERLKVFLPSRKRYQLDDNNDK